RVFERFGMTAMVLPNLADTDKFCFRHRGSFLPRLFVSRSLEPIYDVECVLRAFEQVQHSFPEAVLGIAGDGSEASRLKDLARAMRLRGVHFYGSVRQQALAELYSQYDIYVNASRIDNFPGTLVEAACSGLPIVTTRSGGIPDMIRDGRNGLLVDVGDH